MKKVLPLLLGLFFVLPLNNMFAASDDLLNGKGMYLSNPDNFLISGELINTVTDGNSTTFHSLNYRNHKDKDYYLWQKFDVGVSLRGYLTIMSSGDVTIEFYDQDKSLISSLESNGSGTVERIEIPKVENVHFVALINNKSGSFSRVFEFTVYGVEMGAEPPKEPPKEPSGDVIDLLVDTDYDRVDLSWKLPESDSLKHVNIYRETLDKTFFDKLLGIKTVSAAGEKIFETNGTYFNDLTVAANTKYEYTLTTTSLDGLESSGVSITAITPKKPGPVMGGEETDVDESGSYIFKWTSPTTGKVRILVGGKEYAVVNAADLQITIPAADMKFTFTGAPDVQLIPIDEDGQEGAPTSPPLPNGGSGVVKLPFGPTEVLGGTLGFIGVLSGLILLAIVIYFTPMIIRLIKKAIEKERNKKRAAGRRM